MNAADRRPGGSALSPAIPEEDRQAIVLGEFRYDLAWWIGSNPRTELRVMRLVEEIIRDPFVGTGKPEQLKYDKRGRWSRRITDSDRWCTW
ncbi:MAG TPA: Txe/YoeB family addiction module toxin [Longimicrobium sp.]|jgi:toxin YoeB|nr:Txe/YoeB family addiction module toxin [Longimicrobium sp.]